MAVSYGNIWGMGSPHFLVDSPDLQKLEAARIRHRLTIRDWAKRAGVAESAIRSIMKRRTRPEIGTLSFMAVAVGLTIDDVINGDPTPIPRMEGGSVRSYAKKLATRQRARTCKGRFVA